MARESPDATSYDLAVIGAGSAGLTAARTASRLGARVLLVERGQLGGDCTWSGCVPSKALLHAARAAHDARLGAEMGIVAPHVTVDFPRVMDRVRRAIREVYAHEDPDQLRREGIEVAFAAARFLDPHTLHVGERRVRASRVVICTGADAATPPIAGLRDGPFLTYETVFQLHRLPAHLMVLGAGPIGVELGQAFRRLGAGVTVIEQLDRLLSVADPEVGEVLDRRLREEGLAIHLGAPAERIEQAGSRVAAIVRGERVEGDALLVATGRRPAVEDLGLEQAGVQHDGSGIQVDSGLRTSQRHIYAAGDATGSFQFTHYAAWQGFVAARNALFPGASRGRLPSVPWAVFTDPEVAQVGLTEEEARRQGRKIDVHRWPLQCVDRAQTTGATEGLIKLVTERDGRLLGAALAGAAASELANELSLALRQRLRVSDLSRTIHVYPTYGTGIQQLAAEVSLSHTTKGWHGRVLRMLPRGRRPG